ncbi:SpoIIE family protein phosphatase [Chloroflexia bacterium SDU3-3]|nr:SpoIIE family protein phosphatase [Chloroflexia bacterium SDU3-3]
MPGEFGYLLVVHHHFEIYDSLRAHLESSGYTMICIPEAQQALSMLRKQPSDLVLIALDLPDMRGSDLLTAIKSDPDLHAIPVMMITEHSNSPHLEECLSLGAYDHIHPSMSPMLQQARIRMCLQYGLMHNPTRVNPEKEVLLIKIEHDLQIGQDIQSDFLPRDLPDFPTWQIADFYKPAREVGGDLYDVFTTMHDQYICLIIGDVCDKGVGAALFMALFRSLFRAAAQQQIPASPDQPPYPGDQESQVLYDTFNLVNNYVIDNHGDKGYFATLFFGILNPSDGSLFYVNGGHVPALIVGDQGIKHRLTPTGPAVGIIPNTTFDIQRIQLDPGDILFTYTDGVTDARNPERRLFGEQRLIEMLHTGVSAADLVTQISTQLALHIGNAEQYDDITMLVVEHMAPGSLTHVMPR